MKSPTAKLRLWYLTAGIFALLGALCRTAALLTSFDPHPGYFRVTPLTVALYLLTVAALVALLLPFLFIKREELRATPIPTTLPGAVAAGLMALLMLLNFAVALSLRPTFRLPTLLWAVGLLCLLCGAIYFALRMLAPAPPVSATLLSGYGAIFAFALLLAFTYFDPYTPMNAPHKTALHFCLLAMMAYLVLELRDLASPPMPHARAAVGTVSFFLCFSVGFSNVAAFLLGTYRSVPYLAQDLLVLGFAAYTAARAVADTRGAAPEA